MIEEYLKDLERRIDPDVEYGLFERWRLFADGRLGEGIFFAATVEAGAAIHRLAAGARR